MKKKLLAFALVAGLAMSAQALSFQWTASGVAFNGATLKKSSDVVGYLVYLGSGAEYDSSYSVNESTTASSLGASIGTVVNNSTAATSNAGKLSSAFTFDYGAYDNGDVFGLLLTYSSEGKTYFNLSSSTYTLDGISSDNSQIDQATFSFSYGGPTESSSVKSGGGWVQAVPEPSTAALALAGLALLIRRRKA